MGKAMATIGFAVEMENKASPEVLLLGKQLAMMQKIWGALEKSATQGVEKVEKKVEKSIGPRRKKQLVWYQALFKKAKGGIKEFQQKFEKLDDLLGTSMGTNLKRFLKLGVAVTALFALVKAGQSVEDQLHRVKMASKLTNQQMAATEQQILQTANRYGDSIQEVTDAAVYAGKAKITGPALTEFIDATQLMTNITGQATENVGQFLYHLTKMHGFTGSLQGMASQWKYLTDHLEVSNEQLAEFFGPQLQRVMRTVLPQFKNQAVKEFAAIAAGTANAFGDPSLIQNALFKMTQIDDTQGAVLRARVGEALGISGEGVRQMLKEGKSIDVLKGLSKAAKGLASDTDFSAKQGLYSQLFGDLDSDFIGKLRDLNDGWSDLEPTLRASVAAAGDATYGNSRFADSMATLSKQWEKLKNAGQTALKTLGGPVFDVFSASIEGAASALGGLVGWFQNLSDGKREVIGLFAGLIAAGVVLGTVFSVLIPLTWAWTAALLANPIFLITAGVVVLIGAIIALWKNWDSVMGFFGDSWDWLMQKVANFGLMFARIWLSGVEIVRGVVKKIVGVWRSIWDPFVEKLWAGVEWVMDKLGAVLNPFAKGGAVLRDAWGSFADLIVSSMEFAMKAVVGTLVGAVNWAIDKINDVIDGVPFVDFSIPNIPEMADGGIIRSRSGGTPAIIGEGGQDEAVVPLDDFTSAQYGAAGQIVEKLDWLAHFLVENLAQHPVAAPSGQRHSPAPLNARNQSALQFGT